ncbi:hypothetical protein QTP81_11475 [Alteromonas sp. ASW11-36]|uniref:Uncharacterized protein n=1 Tax=Alteromonas arenosi TaxID=3055817 RepID=A0ABT7SYX7_9ALTE|nr:hypothetical protein [Alteromonas sp. ASW11-36]MDM7861214.1 hypothetical protein [Alteromonas sp. ASW11-36]
MAAPFCISTSENFIKVKFTESFHHTRHYRGLINGIVSVVDNNIHVPRWALLVDWGDWFIQIPEEEKLCMRFLKEYQELGLAYLVNITPKHPIVDWQMEKITDSNPELEIVTTDDVKVGEYWLETKGIKLLTFLENVNETWFNKSASFTHLIKKYGVSDEQFDSH